MYVFKFTGTRNLSSLVLPETHSKLKKICRAFSEAELRPIASILDKQEIFPSEQVKKYKLKFFFFF